MKTLTKEIRPLPDRAPFWEGSRAVKTMTQGIRTLPDRALFWAGALLLTSGALRVEHLPE